MYCTVVQEECNECLECLLVKKLLTDVCQEVFFVAQEHSYV